MTLRAWRRARGFTEEQIAKQLKVGRVTLIRWEKGNKMPVTKALEYCKLLGVDVNDVEFNI